MMILFDMDERSKIKLAKSVLFYDRHVNMSRGSLHLIKNEKAVEWDSNRLPGVSRDFCISRHHAKLPVLDAVRFRLVQCCVQRSSRSRIAPITEVIHAAASSSSLFLGGKCMDC